MMKKRVFSFLLAAAMICNCAAGLTAYAEGAESDGNDYTVTLQADSGNDPQSGKLIGYTVMLNNTTAPDTAAKIVGYDLKVSYNADVLTLVTAGNSDAVSKQEDLYTTCLLPNTSIVLENSGYQSASGTVTLCMNASNASQVSTKNGLVHLVFWVKPLAHATEETTIIMASNAEGYSGLGFSGKDGTFLDGVSYENATATLTCTCSHLDKTNTATWNDTEKAWQVNTVCASCGTALEPDTAATVCTVVLEAAGGSYAADDTAAQALHKNSSNQDTLGAVVTNGSALFPLPSPTKQGYRFNGWKYGETVLTADSVSLSADTTLTAQWTATNITAKLEGTTDTAITISGTYGDAFAATPAITLTGDAAGSGQTFAITMPEGVTQPEGVSINAATGVLSGTIGEAGQKSFNITATGNNGKTCTVPVSYTGEKRDLADTSVISVSDIVDQVVSATGAELKPAVTVLDTKTGKTLTADEDYTLSYDKNIAEGEATVTITGAEKNYTGTRTKTFQIIAKPWPVITLSDSKAVSVPFGTDAASITLPTVTKVEAAEGFADPKTGYTTEFVYSGRDAFGAEYAASTVMPTKAGNYTASIRFTPAKGEDADTVYAEGVTAASVPFIITPVDISTGSTAAFGAENANLNGLTYTGLDLTPEPTEVKHGDTVLADGDYTLTYDQNKNAGDAAKVIVNGAGNYTGKFETIFAIGKATVDVASVSANGKTYNGSDAATGTVTLAAGQNGDAPTATATFKFDSKAAGERTVTAESFVLDADWQNNYQLGDTTNHTATATITPLTVTYDKATVQTEKEYNHDLTAALSTAPQITNKALETDKVSVVAAAEYDGYNAGSHTITVNYTLSGDDMGNYQLPGGAEKVTDTLSGSITKATLTADMVSLAGADSTGKLEIPYDETMHKPEVAITGTMGTKLHKEDLVLSYSSTNPTAAGAYQAFVGVAADGNYKLGESGAIALDYSIAAVPYTSRYTLADPESASLAYDVNKVSTLASIALKPVSGGSWAWKTPTAKPAATGNAAVFTPADPSYTGAEKDAALVLLDLSGVNYPTKELATGASDTVALQNPTGGDSATLRYTVVSSAAGTCAAAIEGSNIKLTAGTAAGFATITVETRTSDNALVGYNKFIVKVTTASAGKTDAQNMVNTAAQLVQDNDNAQQLAPADAKAVIDSTVQALAKLPAADAGAIKAAMANTTTLTALDTLAKRGNYTAAGLFTDVQPTGMKLQSGVGGMAAALGARLAAADVTADPVQYVYTAENAVSGAQLAFSAKTVLKKTGGSTAETAPAAPRRVTLSGTPLDSGRSYYLMGTDAAGKSLGRVECGVPTAANEAQSYAAGGTSAVTYSSNGLCLNFWLSENGTYQLFSTAVSSGSGSSASSSSSQSTAAEQTTPQTESAADAEAKLWLNAYYSIVGAKNGDTVSINANGLSYVPGYILGGAAERNLALVLVNGGETYRIAASVVKSLNSSLNWSWQNLAAWIAKETPVTQTVASGSAGTVEVTAEPTPTPTPAPTATPKPEQATPPATQASQTKAHSPWPIVGIAAAVLAAAGGVIVWRRRAGSKSGNVYHGRR